MKPPGTPFLTPSIFSLGFWGDSSSTLSLGLDEDLLVSEGASNGLEGAVVVAMDWDPL